MIWANKYTPNSLREVKGNEFSIKELRDFIENFKGRRKKAIILVGKTGTGKTCSVYAFAKENNYEVLELNSSDLRNKKNIEEFMDNAINQSSLFLKPKIILVDEIDGLSGTKDRGGSQALTRMIEKTNFPIIMTANDISLNKLSSLTKKSGIIEFNDLTSSEISERLKEIKELENLEISDFILRSISSRAGGDLRGAINDLQLLSCGKIDENNLELIGDRSKEEEISMILRLIFKSKDISLINNGLMDISLDDLQAWVEENIIFEYNSNGIKEAYNYLSKADLFKGRIIRWQYWRFLVYQKFLIENVALAKVKKNDRVIKYKRPRKGLLIWQSNMKNLKRKSISKKLATHYNVSNKKAFRDIFPEVKLLIQDKNVQKELELDEDEINWIKNKG